MRIAVLTTTFPRWAGDYAGNFIQYVAREHARSGAKLCVVAPHAPGATTGERLDGVEVLRFRYALPASKETLAYGGGIFTNLRSGVRSRLLLPAFVLAFFARSAGVVRRCDVVHAHWTLAGIVGLALARVFRKRLVLTVYGIEVFTGRFRALTRLCLRRADHVICISSATAAAARDLAGGLPHEKVSIIPYGVPGDAIDTAPGGSDVRARYGIAPDAPLVLTVGRLIERKGLEHLLRALPMVRAHTPVHAIIAGEGPERARLERLAAELGLSDAVTFAGAVPSSELFAYYDACDVFAHPVITDRSGDVEGLGLVLLEAMARGRAVVASGIGGITDIVVDGDTGYLVTEADASALAGRIVLLLADRALRERLGAAGRRLVVERFTVPALAAQVMEVYQRLERRT